MNLFILTLLKIMPLNRATRGGGLLENYLSFLRMKKAKELINKYKKSGIILDIGCGVYPNFLMSINFTQKFGVDLTINNNYYDNLNLKLINHNLSQNSKLPFPRNFFDVITMLAVVEHFDKANLIRIFHECNSVMKEGAILVITTPPVWCNSLLKIMTLLKLVSSVEIEDHKSQFSFLDLENLLVKANFKRKNIKMDYFEFYMNSWICVLK